MPTFYDLYNLQETYCIS